MGNDGQKMSNSTRLQDVLLGFMRRRNKGRIKGTKNVFKKKMPVGAGGGNAGSAESCQIMVEV